MSAHDYWKTTDPRDDGSREREEARDDLVLDLVAAYSRLPAKIAEADLWADGMQSGEHYSAVERALADLHAVEPADLLGSDVLSRLYRLARVHAAARSEQIQIMAEAEADRLLQDAARDAA